MRKLETVEERRSVLKKVAVAGAAAWVAPTVLSRAAAAQGSGTGCPACVAVSVITSPVVVSCGELSLLPISPPLFFLGAVDETAIEVTCVSVISGGTGVDIPGGLPATGVIPLNIQGLDGPPVLCVSFRCTD